MATRSRVIVKEGKFVEIRKKLEFLGKGWVGVGVQEETKDRQDPRVDNPTVALVNEFGTATVPERSFLRATMDARKNDIARIRNAMLKDVIEGKKSPKAGLDIFGAWLAAAVRRTIVDKADPPNAPATIAKKGFDDPLIHTKQLLNAVTHKVHVTEKRPK